MQHTPEQTEKDLHRILATCRCEPYPETMAKCIEAVEEAQDELDTAMNAAKEICLECGLGFAMHRQDIANALVEAGYFTK